MQVEHRAGLEAFRGELRALVDAATALDDHQLLAPSRCHGWSVLDALVHVHLGLQEVALGLLAGTDGEPDTDAATYWRDFPPHREEPTEEVDGITFLHRLSAAYSRPTRAVTHLAMTARALLGADSALTGRNIASQGHVLSAGDYYTIWAVELAVHHLDLGALGGAGPTGEALQLTRQTIEALVEGPLPHPWSDATAVLVGTGREQPSAAQRADLDPALAARLPALA